MYIEFLGLPGSGKSTIRTKILQKLQVDTHNSYLSSEEAFYKIALTHIDKIYRVPMSILPTKTGERFATKLINRSYMQNEAQNRFLAMHGKALNAFIDSNIYKKMPENEKAMVIGSFLEAGSLRECIKLLSTKSTIIFEEGLLQKSLMFIDHISNTTGDSNNIASYLENIPKPNLTIFIKVNIDDCYQRMLSRPDGLTNRLKNANEKTIYLFLQRINSHLNNVSDWLERNNHPVIHIENNTDLMNAVNASVDSIGKLHQ